MVVEGDTDLPVARKLVRDAGLDVALELDCAGKSQLDEHLSGYNAAAQGSPWFVLRDLNGDALCAAALLEQRRFKPSQWMCFRIAVREMEAWLLADAHEFSAFFDVEETLVPGDPDAEADPTTVIVNLARKSRSGAIRRALVPPPGSSTVVGPLYEAKIIEFGERHWNLARAARRSESLRRARKALRGLGVAWRKFARGPG